MKVAKKVRDILRRQFVAGVLAVVPLIITYVVLKFLFDTVDGILSPLIIKALGYNLPGLGLVTTVLIILLAGFFIRSLIGASLYRRTDRLLTRTPLIRIFYMAAKQLIEAVTMPNIKAFKKVVLVKYMDRDLYAVGFATTRVRIIDTGEGRKELVGVFIPSTPTPVTGFVVFVPEKDISLLDMAVEDALKMLVSGGIVMPEKPLRYAVSDDINNEGEDASRQHAGEQIYY
jgi:uncharacterized membrane protein